MFRNAAGRSMLSRNTDAVLINMTIKIFRLSAYFFDFDNIYTDFVDVLYFIQYILFFYVSRPPDVKHGVVISFSHKTV
jgi:hypothetical protein